MADRAMTKTMKRIDEVRQAEPLSVPTLEQAMRVQGLTKWEKLHGRERTFSDEEVERARGVERDTKADWFFDRPNKGKED